MNYKKCDLCSDPLHGYDTIRGVCSSCIQPDPKPKGDPVSDFPFPDIDGQDESEMLQGLFGFNPDPVADPLVATMFPNPTGRSSRYPSAVSEDFSGLEKLVLAHASHKIMNLSPAAFGDKAAFVRILKPGPRSAVMRARLCGWSYAITDNPEVPRANVTWNGAEDDWLVKAAKSLKAKGRDDALTVLAGKHGRTETAIVCRLEFLGFDRGFTAAMDFSAVEQQVVDRAAATNAVKENPVKITPQRLFLLCKAYVEGGLASGPKVDVNLLEMEGLLKSRFGRWTVTDKGRTLVDSLTGMASTPSKSQVVGFDQDFSRDTKMLDEQTFYLVTSADVQGIDVVILKKPPKRVHRRLEVAEGESSRLAEATPGERFFVLQAISCRKVDRPEPAKPPMNYKRLA